MTMMHASPGRTSALAASGWTRVTRVRSESCDPTHPILVDLRETVPCDPHGLVDLRETVPRDSRGLVDLRETVPCDPHGLVDLRETVPCDSWLQGHFP